MIDDEIDSPMPENFTSTKKTFPEMGENGRSQDGQDGGEAIIDIFATSEKELALCEEDTNIFICSSPLLPFTSEFTSERDQDQCSSPRNENVVNLKTATTLARRSTSSTTTTIATTILEEATSSVQKFTEEMLQSVSSLEPSPDKQSIPPTTATLPSDTVTRPTTTASISATTEATANATTTATLTTSNRRSSIEKKRNENSFGTFDAQIDNKPVCPLSHASFRDRRRIGRTDHRGQKGRSIFTFGPSRPCPSLNVQKAFEDLQTPRDFSFQLSDDEFSSKNGAKNVSPEAAMRPPEAEKISEKSFNRSFNYVDGSRSMGASISSEQNASGNVIKKPSENVESEISEEKETIEKLSQRERENELNKQQIRLGQVKTEENGCCYINKDNNSIIINNNKKSNEAVVNSFVEMLRQEPKVNLAENEVAQSLQLKKEKENVDVDVDVTKDDDDLMKATAEDEDVIVQRRISGNLKDDIEIVDEKFDQGQRVFHSQMTAPTTLTSTSFPSCYCSSHRYPSSQLSYCDAACVIAHASQYFRSCDAVCAPSNCDASCLMPVAVCQFSQIRPFDVSFMSPSPIVTDRQTLKRVNKNKTSRAAVKTSPRPSQSPRLKKCSVRLDDAKAVCDAFIAATKTFRLRHRSIAKKKLRKLKCKEFVNVGKSLNTADMDNNATATTAAATAVLMGTTTAAASITTPNVEKRTSSERFQAKMRAKEIKLKIKMSQEGHFTSTF